MRISLKLIVISEILLLLAVAAVALPMRRSMQNQVTRAMQTQLMSIATTAALHIDGDQHEQVAKTGSADIPAFREIRAALDRVRHVNDIEKPDYIYTFFKDPNENLVRFGVMTHKDPFVGDPYEMREEIADVFETGKPHATDLYWDKHGPWISAYAPIFNSAGDVVGVLDVVMPAEKKLAMVARLSWQALAIALTSIGITSILGLWILGKTVLTPMRAIHTGMRALANQDFQHQVQLRTGDEFEDLARTVNSLSRQLNVAQIIQTGFYPKQLPAPEGYRISARSEPCDATGGDYYDAFEMSGGRIGVVMGDVSGHGLGASLLMSACRSTLRALSQLDVEPGKLVLQLDKMLADDLQAGRFITLIYGILEPDGRFTFTNAGHGPAMILTAQGVMKLDSHRPPLGVWIEDNEQAEQSVIQLDVGDRIFLASDGLIEATNPRNKQFGQPKVEGVVADRDLTYQSVVTQLAEMLREHLSGHAAKDDVTMLCIDRAGGP